MIAVFIRSFSKGWWHTFPLGRDRALGGGFQPDALESAKLAAHSAAFRAAASAVSRFLAASASRSPLSRASLRSASLFSLRPCLVAFVIVKILVSHIERAGLRAVRPRCAIHVWGDMRAVFVDRKKGAVRARITLPAFAKIGTGGDLPRL